MQCDNCGYIFFQPSKKCACCSAPYVPAMSSFEVGQENLFTIFEMAPGEGGIPGGMGVAAGTDVGVDDYNFTDDFDTGEAEYGVDENVLDLSDAEAAGYGVGGSAGPVSVDDFEFDSAGMDSMPTEESAEPDDFELNLADDAADIEVAPTEIAEPAEKAGDDANMDFEGGFDEVEGLGFGFDESPAGETPEATTEEISLDATPEPEISLEPELELPEEEPSLELSEDLDIGDEQPSLELPEEPELSEEPSVITEDMDDFGGEQPSLDLPDDLDLPEEPELMDASIDDDAGIDFDLDNVDLDAPEEVSYEVPEADPDDQATEMDFDGLELEMESPEEPEEDDLNQ